MARESTYDWDVLISDAFDLLAEQDERGVDLVALTERLEVPVHVARQTVNRLRDELAKGDTANVVVRSDGRSRRYVLTTSGDLDWLNFHAKYAASRLGSVLAVYRSVARGTDDEAAKRQAERVVRSLTRAIEDIEDIG